VRATATTSSTKASSLPDEEVAGFGGEVVAHGCARARLVVTESVVCAGTERRLSAAPAGTLHAPDAAFRVLERAPFVRDHRDNASGEAHRAVRWWQNDVRRSHCRVPAGAPGDRPSARRAVARQLMRIAWGGPPPIESGGLHTAAVQLLGGLVRQGASVDCYVAAAPDQLVPELRGETGVELIACPIPTAGDRWYRYAPASVLVAQQAARAIAQRRLFVELLRRHRERPYDVYYQFSQLEVIASRSVLRQLPPVALHPQVHALGERRWLWRERALPQGRGAGLRLAAMSTLLTARARQQGRSLAAATLVIAPSRRFAHDLERDHGLAPEKLRVVPNPVDLERFPLGPGSRSAPLRLLFVSYLAVRKGVEMVVELSRRLRDLSGKVEIVVIGAPRLWSDYRPLLANLEPAIARYEGALESDELPRWFGTSDAILQPSHYEPFGLTLAEGLASGACAVASDVVGAAEDVSSDCVWRFRAGDADSLETAVRRMLGTLGDVGASRRTLARSEAARLFGEGPVVTQLGEALASVYRL